VAAHVPRSSCERRERDEAEYERDDAVATAPPPPRPDTEIPNGPEAQGRIEPSRIAARLPYPISRLTVTVFPSGQGVRRGRATGRTGARHCISAVHERPASTSMRAGPHAAWLPGGPTPCAVVPRRAPGRREGLGRRPSCGSLIARHPQRPL
jgi:hypothetical protein